MEFFHDTTHNVLVYPRHALIEQHVPEARPLNGQYIAVPRTLHNAQLLRWFNFPVPPVMTDLTYDWPIMPGRKPLAHQMQMANFMILHPRGFNLTAMGGMKTLSALWAADWLMQQHPRGSFKALIVSPLSTLDRTWANAIFQNFLSRRKFVILHGDAGKRQRLLEEDVDFFIINPDGVGIGAHTRKKFELGGFSKALAERSDIKMCIVDEASVYKDATTKRHRLARLILGARPYLTLMTGTPTPNAPTDAYGLAKLVNNAYGKSFRSFQEDTMLKVSNFVWRPRPDGYEKARQIMSPSIRFDIKDIWDGPEMTTQQRVVPLTDEQKKLMLQLKNQLTVTVKSGEAVSAVNEAAARQKFIQISLGAIYDQDHKRHLLDATPRIEELKAVLREAPGKTLIFAPLTSVVNLLYSELSKFRKCAMVNGQVSQKERSRIFQEFQDTDKITDIVADPGTMSHGLDLFAAQTVIWYGTTDKTEIYMQANRRAHRPGQKYPVTIVQLVSNKLEIEIYRRLENNETLQGALLDAVRRGDL